MIPMKFPKRHEWNVTTAEARALQTELAEEVIRENRLGEVRLVAGGDVGFEDDGRTTRAAVAVLAFPDLKLVDQVVVRRPTLMPYIPGYLSFREVPALIDGLERLGKRPDLILCDGQGLAHPRRFGLACHLGVLTGIPTIGVAKTRFVGAHEPVGELKGAMAELIHKGDVVGAVLRTRDRVKLLYVSIGHMVDLETAVEYVLRCTPKYRLPETTRQAHRLASVAKDV